MGSDIGAFSNVQNTNTQKTKDKKQDKKKKRPASDTEFLIGGCSSMCKEQEDRIGFTQRTSNDAIFLKCIPIGQFVTENEN